MEKLDKTRYGPDKVQLYHAVQLLIRNQNEIIERLARVEAMASTHQPVIYSLDSLPFAELLRSHGCETIADAAELVTRDEKLHGLGPARKKQILKSINSINPCYN